MSFFETDKNQNVKAHQFLELASQVQDLEKRVRDLETITRTQVGEYISYFNNRPVYSWEITNRQAIHAILDYLEVDLQYVPSSDAKAAVKPKEDDL